MRKRSASTATGRSLLDAGYALNPIRNVPITCYLDKPANRKRRVNQYVKGDRIGKGRHGEVFLARDTLHDHQDVAIKVVKRSNPKDKIKLLRRNYQQTDGSTKQALNSTENSVRREIAVMKQLRHPNLAALLEVIDDPREERIYIIMEYIAGGAVQWTQVEGDRHLPLLSIPQSRRIMRDVILGLEYMHSKGILHRDIKPSNIVYNADRSLVKLIDFGISHIMLPPAPRKEKDDLIDPELRALFTPHDMTKRIGTPSFLAPEVVWFSTDDDDTTVNACDGSSRGTSTTAVNFPMPKVRPQITTAIDIWSLGVTMYCLVFGHTPFSGSSEDNGVHHNEYMLYHQICTQDWSVDAEMGLERIPTGGRHPKDQGSEAYPVIQLLDGMLQKDPKDRTTLYDLKRNPFLLQDIDDVKDWLRCTAPPGTSTDNWVKSAARKLANVLAHKSRNP